MATLAALLADVYSLTNRPDLVAESTLAVKAATLKAHQSDYFFRDQVAGSFNFANPALFVQQFDVSTLTRWRAWAYLQNFDPLITPYQNSNSYVFEIIASNDLIDNYRILKQNSAYQVGTACNIRCAAALATLYYGYFQNPDITNAANMGWISDNHPYAIIIPAARMVFKTIGYDEQYRAYEDMEREQIAELKISNITPVGM